MVRQWQEQAIPLWIYSSRTGLASALPSLFGWLLFIHLLPRIQHLDLLGPLTLLCLFNLEYRTDKSVFYISGPKQIPNRGQVSVQTPTPHLPTHLPSGSLSSLNGSSTPIKTLSILYNCLSWQCTHVRQPAIIPVNIANQLNLQSIRRITFSTHAHDYPRSRATTASQDLSTANYFPSILVPLVWHSSWSCWKLGFTVCSILSCKMS